MVPVAWAEVPVTAGELLQGRVAGTDLLVSCPIARFVRVEVELAPGCGVSAPPQCPKAGRAAELALAAVGGEGRWRVTLRVHNRLPRRRGLATSTADIVAAAQAVAVAASGRPLPPEHLARIAIAIEPSDSIMFPGLALLDHRRGSFWRLLGTPPPAEVALFDYGGEVDAEEFNARPDLAPLSAAKEPQVAAALEWLEAGVAAGNLAWVGRAATLSALAHQAMLAKPGLEEVASWLEEAELPGLCVAHSGTLLGLLLPPGTRLPPGLAQRVTRRTGACHLGQTALAPGGVRCGMGPPALTSPPVQDPAGALPRETAGLRFL